MKVHYIFRNSDPRFHSIESVFGIIVPLVKKRCEVKSTILTHPVATPGGVMKNIGSKEFPKPGVVYHITGHVNYMALKTGRNSVLTIHDMQSALKGNIFARLVKLILWFWIPALIVKRIIVISEFTRSELRRLVPFAGRKTVVVPNPVHPDFTFHRPAGKSNGDPDGADPAKVEPAGSPQPGRILLMGTKPNKNLERTVEALKGLPVTLTIVGALSDRQRERLDNSGLPYENHVDLPHKKLVQCYQESDLLCFASLYEGFGMPIVEAQASGVPVVTSDRGAMSEVAGKGACLVDPEDVTSIRKGLEIILDYPIYRKRLVERGLENVKRFGAEEIAGKYMKVYREVTVKKVRKKSVSLPGKKTGG